MTLSVVKKFLKCFLFRPFSIEIYYEFRRFNVRQQVVTEQQLLSTQLLQKTEEITQLNAKIKFWEFLREKQESECKSHIDDVKNLKAEIKRLKYVCR